MITFKIDVNLLPFRTLKFCSVENCCKHDVNIAGLWAAICSLFYLFFTMVLPEQTNKSTISISACSVCHI